MTYYPSGSGSRHTRAREEYEALMREGPLVACVEECLPDLRWLRATDNPVWTLQQKWRIYSTVDGVPREPYDEWRNIPRHPQ